MGDLDGVLIRRQEWQDRLVIGVAPYVLAFVVLAVFARLLIMRFDIEAASSQPDDQLYLLVRSARRATLIIGAMTIGISGMIVAAAVGEESAGVAWAVLLVCGAYLAAQLLFLRKRRSMYGTKLAQLRVRGVKP